MPKLDVSEILHRLDEMSSDVDSPSDDNDAESEIIPENDGTDAVEAIVKKY